MDRDAGGTCYVLSGGMRGKADDSSVFQTDDNSWYFADLDTDTIFSGTIPDKLTDENGKKLTEEDMTDGDVYLIYGDVSCWKLPGTVSGNHKDGTERTRQSGKGRSLPERAAFHDASGDWRVIK